MANIGKAMEKWELSYTACGNINMYSVLGRQFDNISVL